MPPAGKKKGREGSLCKRAGPSLSIYRSSVRAVYRCEPTPTRVLARHTREQETPGPHVACACTLPTPHERCLLTICTTPVSGLVPTVRLRLRQRLEARVVVHQAARLPLEHGTPQLVQRVGAVPVLVRPQAVRGRAGLRARELRVARVRGDGALGDQQPPLDVAHALERLPHPRQLAALEEGEAVPQALDVVHRRRRPPLKLRQVGVQRRRAARGQLAALHRLLQAARRRHHPKVEHVRLLLPARAGCAKQDVERLEVVVDEARRVQLAQATHHVVPHLAHGGGARGSERVAV
mmetsp:Transcript_17600/g.57531  ORF Transcript_17600/g.57531 Transcript_17600/m.57531 type:complete len:293 (-) Transcript_17600:1276-2154(-)